MRMYADSSSSLDSWADGRTTRFRRGCGAEHGRTAGGGANQQTPLSFFLSFFLSRKKYSRFWAMAAAAAAAAAVPSQYQQQQQYHHSTSSSSGGARERMNNSESAQLIRTQHAPSECVARRHRSSCCHRPRAAASRRSWPGAPRPINMRQ